MSKDRLRRINNLLPQALNGDRIAARNRLNRLKHPGKLRTGDEKTKKELINLEKRLMRSIKKKLSREQHLPRLSYNEALPIVSKKDEIIDTIRNHQVVIISGETGSGKTTQIPKFCLAAGRGIHGMIGCTQPRRIAATTVSRRIAEELGEDLGRSVGYKIRFQDKTAPDAYIKIMTDGILLAETQGDHRLTQYDTLIIDEAHERSLNIDFILGIIKTLLKQRRDLKLIITSATIDTEKFSKAFDDAPIIEVSGRMYPVDVRYEKPGQNEESAEDLTHVESAVRAVDTLLADTRSGDILVFMPSEQDIRETCELIDGSHQEVKALPLFARLPGREQSRVFSQITARKVIVATNIAETSITIPGIKYVVDTGLARISQYMPRSRTTSLSIKPISRSSADQRMGRCGRVENGICIRLYPEEDYTSRPLFTPPEVLRSNLAEVILRMISLKLGNPRIFPFVDSPAPNSITDGFDLLEELGAIAIHSQKERPNRAPEYTLTPRGRLMAKLPLDPRLSRMLLEARENGCLQDMIVITSSLSVQDPWERPADKAEAADRKHALFKQPASDFMTMLTVWEQYRQIWRKEKSTGKMKRFCKAHFLSYRRIREWQDVHTQISAILKEQAIRERKTTQQDPRRSAPQGGGRRKKTEDIEPRGFDPRYTAIHKSILSGFLSNIGLKKTGNMYRAAKDREAMVFPGSTLFGQAGKWIMAAEMVETSRLFARTVANIDNSWLEELGKSQCKYTYHAPHWERNRGEVVASEQITLFGLIIVADRTSSYGPIDPKTSTDIFIRNALVEGDVKKTLKFMRHNRALVDGIRSMENKIRRRDLLIGDEEMVWFYQDRLGICYDTRSLQKHLREKGTDQHLRMTREALLRYMPDAEELSLFPDQIRMGRNRLNLDYRFDPGKPDDGLTIRIPSTLAPEISKDAIDWLVPGLFREKVTMLIKGLPKVNRKQLVPVANTVDIIMDEMPEVDGSLLTALGAFIHKRFSVDIPSSAWPDALLPDHLKARISITGPKGEELRAGRDPSILNSTASGRQEPKALGAMRKKWERTGVKQWDFDDIPEQISIDTHGDTPWVVYPGLEENPKDPTSVNLRLFNGRDKALASHRSALVILFSNHFTKDLRFLKKRLSLPEDPAIESTPFGGTKALEKRLYQWVLRKLFTRNIRSEKAFSDYAEEISPTLMTVGQRHFDAVIPVLDTYYRTHLTLKDLEKTHRFNAIAQQFIEDLGNQIRKLVPENFMDLYEPERFGHIPKYIKAIEIRAQRALVDFEKDREKATEIDSFADKLNELISKLPPSVTSEKQKALEDFFWMIEEYKVSLFAQELKTAIPVSRKRLDKKLKEIQRMV